MDYYTTIKRNELLIHVTTCMYGSKNYVSEKNATHKRLTSPSGTLSAIVLIYCGLGSCGLGTNHHHIPATQQLGLQIELYLSRHSCSAKTPGSIFQSQPVLSLMLQVLLPKAAGFLPLLSGSPLDIWSDWREVACHSGVRLILLTATLYVLRISHPCLAPGGLSKHNAFTMLSFLSLPFLTQFFCICCSFCLGNWTFPFSALQMLTHS